MSIERLLPSGYEPARIVDALVLAPKLEVVAVAELRKKDLVRFAAVRAENTAIAAKAFHGLLRIYDAQQDQHTEISMMPHLQIDPAPRYDRLSELLAADEAHAVDMHSLHMFMDEVKDILEVCSPRDLTFGFESNVLPRMVGLKTLGICMDFVEAWVDKQ